MSLKFVPKGPINNIPALIEKMAWRQATRHHLNQLWLICWRIYVSLGLNELKWKGDVLNFYAHVSHSMQIRFKSDNSGLFMHV